MEEYKKVNFDEAVARLGLSKEFLNKLINKFFDGDLLQKTEDSFNAKDMEGAKLNIHTIKGTGANLGFVGLYELALNIEIKMKEEQLDFEQFELLKQVWVELKEKYSSN